MDSSLVLVVVVVVVIGPRGTKSGERAVGLQAADDEAKSEQREV